ncbi:hypothetical protein ACTHQW_13740 [Dietzia maris]
MFERMIDYPCAVAEDDQANEGVRLAWRWVLDHVSENSKDAVLWAPQKQSLRGNQLAQRIAAMPGVRTATGRGSTYHGSRGPVLALWPDIDELATICHYGASALAVVMWGEPFRLWANEVGAEFLSRDPETQDEPEPTLEPEVVSALETITSLINQSNSIGSRGYDKRDTVKPLLDLHDRGFRPDDKLVRQWAAAHGWRGENVAHLGSYVRDIIAGKRLQIR